MKNSIIENELEECAFEVENIAQVKVVSALQRIIDHVVIKTNGLPLYEPKADVKVDGQSWIKITAPLLHEMSSSSDTNKMEDIVHLREMNGASLMLEIADRLEITEDVVLDDINANKGESGFSSLNVLGSLLNYYPLVQGRAIPLDCEPRPFNYRLVDGGPDQKQANLPTKIAAAIEFRMEMNAHACIQRRAERDSAANEAERGNSILGRAAAIGSSITNSSFKTFDDCVQKLESDLEDRSVNPEEIAKLKSIAVSFGDEFLAEMNMWYGAKELANRWNGFPCFGQTIFAKTPLSFYQQPLSHLLEADIQAYSKASKSEKETSERFDWIRQNLKWYSNHGKISPSGYYEERRTCDDPNCCGTRIVPLDTPQTPKPSIYKMGHYEELKVVERMREEISLEERLKNLNLFPDLPVNEKQYREMDYFLPSKALETVFTYRHGLTEKEMQDFRRVFPCPEESLTEGITRLLEKEKTKEREKLPISLRKHPG